MPAVYVRYLAPGRHHFYAGKLNKHVGVLLMEKLFILNPSANALALKDGLEERLDKLKGVMNVLMYASVYKNDTELDNNTIYHTLWAMDGLLDEAYQLQEAMDKNITTES